MYTFPVSFRPAAPAGAAIGINTGAAGVDARHIIPQFRPARSPDMIVIVSTFFLTVTKRKGPDRRPFADFKPWLEAFFGVNCIVYIHIEVPILIHGETGIATQTDAIVIIIRRTRQKGKDPRLLIAVFVQSAFVMTIREETDVLEPQFRIFCREFLTGVNVDIITGNIIVRRFGYGMRRRNEPVSDIACTIIHFCPGPADVRHGIHKSLNRVHSSTRTCTRVRQTRRFQRHGTVQIDCFSRCMIYLGLRIAFYRIGMDFIHPPHDVHIAAAGHKTVLAADKYFICRHVDRLLGQDYIVGSRSFIQIDCLYTVCSRPGYRQCFFPMIFYYSAALVSWHVLGRNLQRKRQQCQKNRHCQPFIHLCHLSIIHSSV